MVGSNGLFSFQEQSISFCLVQEWSFTSWKYASEKVMLHRRTSMLGLNYFAILAIL